MSSLLRLCRHHGAIGSAAAAGSLALVLGQDVAGLRGAFMDGPVAWIVLAVLFAGYATLLASLVQAGMKLNGKDEGRAWLAEPVRIRNDRPRR